MRQILPAVLSHKGFALLVFIHVNQIKSVLPAVGSSQHVKKSVRTLRHVSPAAACRICGEIVTGCFTEKVIYLLKPSVLSPTSSAPLSQKIYNGACCCAWNNTKSDILIEFTGKTALTARFCESGAVTPSYVLCLIPTSG